MDKTKWNDAQVAQETFNVLIGSFAWQNEYFDDICENNTKKFKSYQKKFFILFCISIKTNCTLTDLERMLHENRSTTSVAVSKLYDEGLIEKSYPEKGDDGRKVYFKVTEKGTEILIEYKNKFINNVRRFFNDLPEEKKTFFVEGIGNLNKIFAK